MYKQFTCNNDNVYIADDKGNLTIREYSNNIKDILDKENEIKVLEVELDKESKLKKQAEKSIKSKKVLVKYLLASIGIPVVFYVVTGVGSKLLLSPEQFESLLVYTPRFPEGINEFSIFSLEIGMFTISLGIIGTVVELRRKHL